MGAVPARRVVEMAGAGTSGHVTFSGATIEGDPKLGPPSAEWPPTFSGEISWQCQPWLDANATPPPPVGATLTLSLQGVDWSAAADGAAAECSIEADGSASEVTSSPAGLLQGFEVTA